MSFRIEEKLLIDKNQIIDFKNFLLINSAYQLFPSRKIQSLYFENFQNEMYEDSIEGLVPRKKIRVRTYPRDKKINFNYEVKISSVEGRFKTSKVIDQGKFDYIKKMGIHDNQYGTCRPTRSSTTDLE